MHIHPRLRIFVRLMLDAAVYSLAVIGAVGLYRGELDVGNWSAIAAVLIGATLAAFMRDVPEDLADEDELLDLSAHAKKMLPRD